MHIAHNLVSTGGKLLAAAGMLIVLIVIAPNWRKYLGRTVLLVALVAMTTSTATFWAALYAWHHDVHGANVFRDAQVYVGLCTAWTIMTAGLAAVAIATERKATA